MAKPAPCPACGAKVPSDVETCPACGAGRADVALLEVEPGLPLTPGDADVTEPDVVTVEPRRRRWVLIGLGVAAVWLVGALLVGRDSSPGNEAASSTTTTPPTLVGPATTRPPRAPPGTAVLAELPGVLGGPTGLRLLLYGGQTSVEIDLDTGVVRTAGRSAVLYANELGTVISVGGGVAWAGEGESPVAMLGPADEILSAGHPTRLWLVTYGFDGLPPTARLVGIDGAEIASVGVPPLAGNRGIRAVGTLGDELVVSAGGRVFGLPSSGSSVVLADGELQRATGDLAVVETCDDALNCSLALVRPEGPPMPLVLPPGYSYVSGRAAPTADGRFALVVFNDGTGSAILIGDASGALRSAAVGVLPAQDVAWSPDGRYLFALDQSGDGVVYVDTTDDTTGRLDLDGRDSSRLAVSGP